MNIDAWFDRLTPCPWSDVLALSPLERAKRFVVPLEEDVGRATLAKSLVAEIIAGRQTAAGVRWKYSGTDQRRAACFNLAASFYHGCFNGARHYLQGEDPNSVDLWPCLEFDDQEKCHATCRSLRKKRLPRRNAAVRSFHPPWHFGCAMYEMDSDGKPSRNFTLSIVPDKMEYYHNPIDVLVSQGLLADFAGVDFDHHKAAVLDLTLVKARVDGPVQ